MTAPLPARGAITLHAADQEIASRWWSRRFIELLESFGLGSRLERGLEYARSGQVLELDVEPGIVLAKVQGSRYTPYRVRIRPQVFSEHQWRRAEKAIAARSLTLASLLAGQLPDDIEEVLQSAKLALLPSSYDELRPSCTCPDTANPCKHTAAVYYILAERFDAEPFALLTLRGRTQEELIDGLRARRARARRGGAPAARAQGADDHVRAADDDPPASLASVLDRFWRCGPELADLEISPLASDAPDAALRQLGLSELPVTGAIANSDPSAGADQSLVDVLAEAYRKLAAAAERRALSA